MDQRDDQLLHEVPRVSSAGTPLTSAAPLFLDELRKPRERVAPRDAHVGIHENEERMTRKPGQLMAGKILSAPAGGQRIQRFRAGPADPSVAIVAHDLSGAIRRVVVEHDHFKIDPLASQNRTQARARYCPPHCAPESGPNISRDLDQLAGSGA